MPHPIVDSASRSEVGRRLTELFCGLAVIPSPTGSEGACADHVIALLAEVGLDVVRDGAGAVVGSDADNLHCTIPATAAGEPIFLCAHLDTVPEAFPVEPVIVDGVISNASPSIVGADNKAALAVILDVAQSVIREGRPHSGLELVFTIGEERGLLGSSVFDVSVLTAQSGFVLDHPGAIGGYVRSAPSRAIVRAHVTGRAAHIGIAPEEGRNAIVALVQGLASLPQPPQGVTVNVALVQGGEALNIIPEHASVTIDVRAIHHDEGVRVVEQIEVALTDACARAACALQFDVQRPYVGYVLPEDSSALGLAQAAFQMLGLAAYPLETHGGSDANAFRAAGLDCVNLNHGVLDFHGPDERVAVADLVLMRDVLLLAIEAACRQ